MRVKCTCTHDFQDRRYGKGNRVANPTAKGNARCTVCSREHILTHSEGGKAKRKGGGGGGGAKTLTVYPPPGGWPGGLPENNGYKKIT